MKECVVCGLPAYYKVSTLCPQCWLNDVKLRMEEALKFVERHRLGEWADFVEMVEGSVEDCPSQK